MNESKLRASIEAELEGNLLPFWRARCLDDETGGFIAEMANSGQIDKNAPKGLILNSRILWTFSALFDQRRNPQDLALACRAYEWIEETMRDRRNGGYLWRVAADGAPLDGEKKIYGQAFVIYALAAYAQAVGEARAAESARDLFELIETHAHDSENGGYIEARAEDWTAAPELRLSDKDMVAAKSMNTHLHVLEAYTALYRIWPETRIAERLRELIDLFGRHILDGERRHLRHFFDERWGVLSRTYTYGHDIEATWLLCEAAEVLDDAELRAAVSSWAFTIARAVLDEAIDDDGGLVYQGRAGEIIDPNREWWCQAEAIVGFWQVWQLTGDTTFSEATARTWKFITRFIVDRSDGEWFWRVFPHGAPDQREPKVSEWKGPYHNVRMCLEMMRRIGAGERFAS